MHPAAPRSRRAFHHVWDELSYCSQKAHYYMYVASRWTLARRYVLRMKSMLPSIKGNRSALVRARSRALCFEFDGRWARGLVCREEELRLVKRLYATFGGPQAVDWRAKWFVQSGYARRDVLARLVAIGRVYEEEAAPELFLRLREMGMRVLGPANGRPRARAAQKDRR